MYIGKHLKIIKLHFVNFDPDDFPHHPRGYRQQSSHPILRTRGSTHCSDCLCCPCLVAQPPDFLVGSAGPHAANDEKRYRLYRLFWALLNKLGVWGDDVYLEKKQRRTSIYDKREIIPLCIVRVSIYTHNNILKI